MSVDRRLLNWGVFLLILGGIPLAVNQGLVPADTFSRAWQAWPLLLVGAGIGLILSRTPFAFIGGLVVAATFGVIIGGLLVGGINLGSIGCSSAAANAPVTADQRGTFTVQPGRVDLRLDCGSLTVGRADGPEWTFSATGDQRSRPTIASDSDNLVIRSPGGFSIPFMGGQGASWRLALPTHSLDVQAQLNAADARLAMGGLSLTRLALDANATSTRVDLADAVVEELRVEVNAADLRMVLPTGGTTGTVSANAASVHLCVPDGVRLRLAVGDSTVSSDNFGSRGLIKTGRTWESPPGGGALVDLRLDGNAASFSLDAPAACR